MGLELEPDRADRALPRTPVYTGPGWNLAQRVAFRFALVYLVLYILPFPVSAALELLTNAQSAVAGDPEPGAEAPPLTRYLTDPVEKHVLKPYEDFWDEVVLRTGKKVFDKDIEYRPLGSGDTTWNYVQLLVFAVLAAAVTLLWSLAAWAWWRLRRRSRLGYPHLHEWLRVYVRFYLAYEMAVYGLMKVVKLQFAYPAPDRWLETYGESSPMHLLWTFMGASDSYTWFTGAGELAAGLLLTTRRTTLLGALVTFGVMVHVVALNFSYDVPVKLFSSHLALFAVFLMAPDLPWLARVFVLGERATPRGYTPLVRRRWLDWALFVQRSAVVLTYLGVEVYDKNETSKRYGRQVPEPPLYGLWEVEEFAIDGKVRPPLTTDGGRWSRVAFHKAVGFHKTPPPVPTVWVRNMPGKIALVAQVVVDEEAKTLTLTQRGGPPDRPPAEYVLHYTQPEERVIEIEGEVPFYADGKPGPKKVKARLRHYGKDQFLLSGRGFHWVNEWPYNQVGPKNEPPPKIPPPPKRP